MDTKTSSGSIFEIFIATTIFISAFLLFQIQPLIAAVILPWFGGTPNVWTTAMLFFQILLLLGYGAAHFLHKSFTLRVQIIIFLSLVAVSLLAACYSMPSAEWKPMNSASPELMILKILLVHIGLPYFILSTVSPLLQAWFATACKDRSPYRLYSISNLGSLLGLLSYPLVFQVYLRLKQQFYVFAGIYAVFALFMICSGLLLFRNRKENGVVADGRLMKDIPISSPSIKDRILWVIYSACGSTLLLATTNHLCHDVAVFPLLWVIPLVIYLLTFIYAFADSRPYDRRIFYVLAYVMLASLSHKSIGTADTSLILAILFFPVLLFTLCTICHSELVRLKPHANYLTSFYLSMSAGGALGGLFVSLLAPRIFNDYYEFPIALGVIMALMFLNVFFQEEFRVKYFSPLFTKILALVLFCFGLNSLLPFIFHPYQGRHIFQERNFYGVIKVLDIGSKLLRHPVRMLINGRITHGTQLLRPDRELISTSYYARGSGVDIALRNLPNQSGRRIGAIGLGAGTVAALGKSGDYFRFYEINPLDLATAENYFTFLRKSPAKSEVVLGDGRISLEREEKQNFDFLILDAFSSDSIPIHLLTKEAFELYLEHLKADGMMAIHITNRHIDLLPVVIAAAKHFRLEYRVIKHNVPLRNEIAKTSHYVLLARNASIFDAEDIKNTAAYSSELPEVGDFEMWTDDYSSLLRVLRWNLDIDVIKSIKMLFVEK